MSSPHLRELVGRCALVVPCLGITYLVLLFLNTLGYNAWLLLLIPLSGLQIPSNIWNVFVGFYITSVPVVLSAQGIAVMGLTVVLVGYYAFLRHKKL